jgi:hypothetical protein
MLIPTDPIRYTFFKNKTTHKVKGLDAWYPIPLSL